MRRLDPRPLVALLLLAGCNDTAGPKTPSMTGNWSAISIQRVLTLSVTESGGRVTGGGSFSTTALETTVSVEGAHTHPDVFLTVHPAGYNDFTYAGTFVTDDSIAGTLNGSGFNNDSLSLQRGH